MFAVCGLNDGCWVHDCTPTCEMPYASCHQGDMQINEGLAHACQNATDVGKAVDPQGYLVIAGGFKMAQPL